MELNNVKHIDLTYNNPVCEENHDCSSDAQPFAYAIEMKEQYLVSTNGSDADEVAKFCPQTLVLKDYL